MRRKNWVFIALFLGLTNWALGQQVPQQLGLIGFYNVENLFDTIDSPNTNDIEFTPGGSNAWTGKRYAEKLDRLGQVISEMGTN